MNDETLLKFIRNKLSEKPVLIYVSDELKNLIEKTRFEFIEVNE
jgi:hypothetical protein